MKTKLKLFLSAGLLAPILAFAPVVVFGHGGENANSPNTVSAQDTTTEEEVVDPVAIKERVAKRKTDLKTRISFAQQTQLKNRCKASQGNLSNIRGRIKGLETSRSQVYENLVSRLTKLGEHLKTKGVDTAELDAEITELNALIETFNTDLATYKEAVSDLAEMDCVADPTGFQASLDAARAARAKTAEDAKAIRTYLTDTIKPTLKDLKSQVEKETESGETE